jgi:hypothetical protein
VFILIFCKSRFLFSGLKGNSPEVVHIGGSCLAKAQRISEKGPQGCGRSPQPTVKDHEMVYPVGLTDALKRPQHSSWNRDVPLLPDSSLAALSQACA